MVALGERMGEKVGKSLGTFGKASPQPQPQFAHLKHLGGGLQRRVLWKFTGETFSPSVFHFTKNGSISSSCRYTDFF